MVGPNSAAVESDLPVEEGWDERYGIERGHEVYPAHPFESSQGPVVAKAPAAASMMSGFVRFEWNLAAVEAVREIH